MKKSFRLDQPQMGGSHTINAQHISGNKTMRQELLPTKTYEQCKAQVTITDTTCRMCHTDTESTTHVLSACSRVAQPLYTATHDRMLRPIYHYLQDKHNFQECDHGKPWYQQSPPHAVPENGKDVSECALYS